MYSVLGAEPLVYLPQIIQGLVFSCILCVGRRALGVSDQHYPRVGGLLYTVVVGRSLGVSEQDYPNVGGLLCTVC